MPQVPLREKILKGVDNGLGWMRMNGYERTAADYDKFLEQHSTSLHYDVILLNIQGVLSDHDRQKDWKKFIDELVEKENEKLINKNEF